MGLQHYLLPELAYMMKGMLGRRGKQGTAALRVAILASTTSRSRSWCSGGCRTSVWSSDEHKAAVVCVLVGGGGAVVIQWLLHIDSKKDRGRIRIK